MNIGVASNRRVVPAAGNTVALNLVSATPSESTKMLTIFREASASDLRLTAPGTHGTCEPRFLGWRRDDRTWLLRGFAACLFV